MMKHIPVLQSTILDLLAPKEGETVLDVTVGLGGHARAFIERIGKRGRLIGIDADEENLREAAKILNVSKVKNVELIHGNFRRCFDSAQHDTCHLPPCDIIFADLGLSSPHIDDPSRGFSFRSDGPLDCRYDRTQGKTAAELLQGESEAKLQEIFREYGELPKISALVNAILRRRKTYPIATTRDLAEVTEEVYGWRAKGLMAQVFQALRIAVNDELASLQVLLKAGPTLLKRGGRMGIISYHSLEDRMVKARFRELSKGEKHPVTGAPLAAPAFTLLTKKPLEPTLEEVTENPRARSARFRAVRLAPSALAHGKP